MLRYLFRRILLALPTLALVSLLAFAISAGAPGSPVEEACPVLQGYGPGGDYHQLLACQERVARRYGLDQPLFYFSIHSLAEPDTLYRLRDLQIREGLNRLALQTGHWEPVQQFFLSATGLIGQLQQNGGGQDEIAIILGTLQAGTTDRIDFLMKRLADSKLMQRPSDLGLYHQEFQSSWNKLNSTKTSWRSLLPAISWHGFECRYHQWLTGVFRGDFGRSYRGGRPIGRRIGELFSWSAFFVLLSTLLAFAISIPLGVWAALNQNSPLDRGAALITFSLDAIPNFWLATILLLLFANPAVLDWFPATFNLPYPTPGQRLGRLILPLIAYTYGAIAYLSRTMRASMLEVLSQDYIRAALARGIPRRRVIIRHALRNALLPMITVLAGLFPALLSGSVVLENIFSIPGMGREILLASTQNDTPMILAIFVLTGALTILGYLVADLLYAWADPRIRFGQNTNSRSGHAK